MYNNLDLIIGFLIMAIPAFLAMDRRERKQEHERRERARLERYKKGVWRNC